MFEDIELKVPFNHDILQATDEDGTAIGPLFIEVSGTVQPLKLIEGEATNFNRDSTLFLIAEVKKRLDILLDSDKPRTLAELRDRMSQRRGNMKKMWCDIAKELSKCFGFIFDVDKVRRKWQTLVDGYKNYIDNQSRTGAAKSKFEFKDQMEELIGDRHDIRPIVTATAGGVTVHRPEDTLLDETEPLSTCSDTEESVSHARPAAGSNATRPKKAPKKKADKFAQLLEHMRETDANLIAAFNESSNTFERVAMAMVGALRPVSRSDSPSPSVQK